MWCKLVFNKTLVTPGHSRNKPAIEIEIKIDKIYWYNIKRHVFNVKTFDDYHVGCVWVLGIVLLKLLKHNIMIMKTQCNLNLTFNFGAKYSHGYCLKD